MSDNSPEASSWWWSRDRPHLHGERGRRYQSAHCQPAMARPTRPEEGRPQAGHLPLELSAMALIGRTLGGDKEVCAGARRRDIPVLVADQGLGPSRSARPRSDRADQPGSPTVGLWESAAGDPASLRTRSARAATPTERGRIAARWRSPPPGRPSSAAYATRTANQQPAKDQCRPCQVVPAGRVAQRQPDRSWVWCPPLQPTERSP